MTRRWMSGLIVGALLAVPAAAAAQNVYFIPETTYGFGVDTAFTIPVGGTRRVQLYANVSGGVSSYSVTVFFDTTRLRLVRADSVPGYGLPSPTVTPIANGVTLTATGSGSGFSSYVAMLELEMKASATTGSLVSLRVNQWLTQAGAPAPATGLRTDLLNTCLARALWGDPDSSLTVTGRDALIALTSAVGLPVSGFDLSLADVDDDLAVTSRDALLMLSYAVGGTVYYYYYERTGVPRAAACAPLAGVPSAMAFIRDDATNGTLYRVAAGDTVAVLVGSPTQFGDVSQFARWSPDGATILGTAYVTTLSNYDLVAVDVGTLAQDTLARTSSYDGGGTYSPSGAQIAFFSLRSASYLWLMDANGANPVQAQSAATVTNYNTTNPAWSPDGQRIAFTGYPVGAGTSGLMSLRVDSATVREEFPRSTSYPPLHPSWSPAGDSLLFQANARIYRVAAPDTATVPREAVSLSGTLNWPSWTAAGIVFRRNQSTSSPTTYDYYLRQPDGRILRIFRAAGTVDNGASFR
jgi:WD40-like Beta Propeller Repeat